MFRTNIHQLKQYINQWESLTFQQFSHKNDNKNEKTKNTTLSKSNFAKKLIHNYIKKGDFNIALIKKYRVYTVTG